MTPSSSATELCITGIGVRANIRWGGGGGADRVLPEWIQGVVAEMFRDPYSVGGGGSSRNCPRPIRLGGGVVVAEFVPLTAVTDPKFVLFKHVLGFARII